MTVTIENTFTGNGTKTDYQFTFPYLDDTDIKASLDGVVTTNFRLLNATTVQFVNNTTANTPTAPANGVAIRIYRDTAFETPKATFYPGSAIRANDLNDNTLQNLYVNQESNDKVADAWLTGDPTIISTETWYTTDDTKIGTTKAIENRIGAKIDTAMEADVLAGTDLAKTASGGQVTINHSVGGANTTVNNSDGNVIQDITITAQGHVTAVGSKNLNDVYYTEAELDAGQLDNRYYTETETGTLIDNKIDTALGSDVLAGQSITKNASGGQVTISIANGAIGADQIAADAVGASELADNAVASANIIDGSIVNADINASADIAGSKLADDSVTLAKLGSGALPTDITIASANIVNGTIVDADIAAGTLDNRYFTETELTGGALDDRYYTETESDARYFNISTGDTIKDGDTFPDNDTTIATTAAINDRIIDLVDDVGGFVPIANETSFPNTNPDIDNNAGTLVSIKALASNLTSNGSGVATIANGTVGNSTVTITGLANSTTYAATFGMIVETTSTLNTYTFHRQVPKATEVTTVAGSISNVNTVAGDISNVNAVAGNATNINTVAGNNSNVTSVAGNASNINSAVSNASNINSAVSNASNINTVAGAISNVNSVGGSIANVNTVATNISNVNDFSDKYRVASSAPTSSLDTGDLYFDTTANELKVYNGSAWQGGVTATGSLAGLGANTFTGSQSLGDNNKVIFGTGGDLEIYHDATDSYITSATGELRVYSNGGILRMRAKTNENAILAIPDQGVELYYDNSKKFETYASGINVTGKINPTGNIHMPDNTGIKLGASDDFVLYHNTTDSTNRIESVTNCPILFQYWNGSAYEVMSKMVPDGAVELYHNNAKKLETYASGLYITGHIVANQDDSNLVLGAGDDLKLWHNGTDSYIKNTTNWLNLNSDKIYLGNAANNEAYFKALANGAVELYYDNVKRFETNAYGVKVNGHIYADDTHKVQLGSSQDLEIYHDGTNSFIKNNTNSFRILANDFGVNDLANGEVLMQAVKDGAVDLYYDNVKTFATTTNGAIVYGAEGSGAQLYLYADEGDDNADKWKFSTGNDGDVYFQNYADGAWETNTLWKHGGAVELYYDNSKKLETTASGVNITGGLNLTDHLTLDDTDKIKLGDGEDLQIYHDGTNNVFKSSNGEIRFVYGDDYMFRAVPDAANRFYYDHSTKAETTSTGFMVNGHLDLVDNNRARFGSSDDLQIYHDGSHSNILNTTGNLYINASASDTAIACKPDGAVELYYDNAKKFETHASGATLSGTLSANAGAFFDNGNAGPVINISGDDASLWYGRIGNETYHDNVNTGFKFYVTDGGNISFQHHGNAEYKDWSIASHNGTTSQYDIYSTGNGSLYLYYQAAVKLTTTNVGVTIGGTVTDTKGELRTIVQNTQSGAYTLVAADAGKHILASGNITVPDSVFSAGQAITIVNNTGGNLTITKGTNMYNTADGSNANRTLATRGMATLLFTAADTSYISGAGLS